MPAMEQEIPSFGRGKHSARLYAVRRFGALPHAPCIQTKEGETMKTERFNLRMTPEEKALIAEKARKAGRPMSEYMIDAALNHTVTVIEGLPELVRELKAVGNNVNQLTALAHIGRVRTIHFEEFTEKLADIYSELYRLAKVI